MVVGNITYPGMYTLSGGSTPLSLIRAAGGIDAKGSYRNIEHKRNGKIINVIDLYSVFINGDMSKLSQLRSGDSLVVRPSGIEVQISGGVASPAIYELSKNEDLKFLLDYAGYFTNSSDNQLIINRRNVNGKYEKLSVDINEAPDFKLIYGDSVDVPYVDPKFAETRIITITGEVEIPGTYYVDDQTRLSDLILRAGGYSSNAYPLGGVFIRQSAVSIEQELKERSYNELIRFMLSSQAAGGISGESLITFLSLLKQYEPTGRLVSEFELSQLKKSPSRDRLLVDGDEIHIPAFTNQVYVYGEVLNPSAYDYDPSLSHLDYLTLSGGFSRSADENKIILISPNGTATSVNIGFFKNLSTNQQILPGSLIYVPQYVGKVEGLSLASAVAPIISSFALSIASLNSINN